MTINTLSDALEDDSSDDLDSLLADSVQRIQDTKKLTKGKDKLASSWLSAAEKATLKIDVDKAASRRQWTTVAAVSIFREQHCLCCGSFHWHFQGLFLEQAYLSGLPGTYRWVRSPDTVSMEGLPRRRKIDKEDSDICFLCADKGGW